MITPTSSIGWESNPTAQEAGILPTESCDKAIINNKLCWYRFSTVTVLSQLYID